MVTMSFTRKKAPPWRPAPPSAKAQFRPFSRRLSRREQPEPHHPRIGSVGSVGSVACFVGCTLWLFNIAMEAMAHRNRWFTYIKNGDFPWLCYTQSGKSVHRLFENKSQWDAAHSGSHRSQCKIMQISMGRCAPAIICFVSCSVFFMALKLGIILRTLHLCSHCFRLC